MAGRSSIDLQREFEFALAPPALWHALESVDQYQTWWPWLEEFDADGLHAGAAWRGVFAPPFPYRMRVRIEIVDAVAPSTIHANIAGDLVGLAGVTLRPSTTGTVISVQWSLTMTSTPIRVASRLVSPLMRWAQDWVVDHTVSGFRRQLGADIPPNG